jgi:hypothetical protein
LTRTWRGWPECWPGDLDVRDEFRNGVFPFPVDLSKFGVGEFGIFIIFFGVVAKFRNKERSVGIGDAGKLVCFKEFVLEEVDVTNFGDNLVCLRIVYTVLCISIIT